VCLDDACPLKQDLQRFWAAGTNPKKPNIEIMRYHYSLKENETSNPVEFSELQRLASTGIIDDETPVIPEGGQSWTTYRAVRQSAPASAAAEAVVGGISRAHTALKNFSWGQMVFGLLLALMGTLTLPWMVISGAARELAQWGKQRVLPTSSSDLPVLTFYVVVMRNFTLVLWAVFFVIAATLQLFGLLSSLFDPFHRGGWSPAAAIGGAIALLVIGYTSVVVLAFLFEGLSVGVRIANDIKKIAQR